MFLIAALGAVPLLAQFSERIDVVAVEVPIAVRDKTGKVPLDLTKADFEVFEDGVRQEVIGLAYPVSYVATAPDAPQQIAPMPPRQAAPQRWQIVIFIQESVSSTSGLRIAMKGLVEQADRLASMGDVEIVSDFIAPHVVLPPTHDASVLRKALENLQRTAFGHEEILQLRQVYEREKKYLQLLEPQQLINDAVFAARTEAGLIRRRQDQLLAWMARYAVGSEGAQRLLMFVSDGFSLDPINYYSTLNGETAGDLGDLRSLTSAPRQNDIARTIAAQGWTVYSVAPAALRQANSLGTMMETTYDSLRQQADNAPMPIFDVLDPMRMLDAESGGKLVTDMRRLGGDIESFTQRLTLTYQVRRRRDGSLHRLVIRALRPGLSVESQHSVMSGSPETIATARATALAMNFGPRGELPVTCAIRPARTPGDETLDVAVDFAPLAGARGGMKAATLRVAVGVAPEKLMPFSDVQNVENVDLSKHSMYEILIPLHKRAGAPAAVVAEEIGSGAWGGSVCELAPARGSDVAHLPERWLALDDALSVARTKQSLVLLYLRGANGDNKRSDEWIAKSGDYGPLSYQYDKVALANATAGEPILEAHEELARVHQSRGPRLIVLDYLGSPILELPASFSGDFTQLALSLGDVAGQTETFAASAELLKQGALADALIKRGYALVNAGIAGEAFDSFTRATDAAKKEGNREAEQYAALGLARLRMRSASRMLTEIAAATDIAQNAASPGVAASAWLLIGQARMAKKDTTAAAKAFAEAYRNAPKSSALAETAHRGLQATGAPTPEEIVAAESGDLRLIYPRRAVQVGTLDVLAAAPATATRVEFYLDEQRITEAARTPFRARVPLGNTPRPHVLRAVAYDGAGKRIAASSAALNSAVGALSVAITAPRENDVESQTTLEIEPRAAEGSSITAVDVYWNDRKLAALTAPPYRYELTLPEKRAFGYVRVVAHDSAGATAEDAKLINATGAAEEVRVDAVELHAVTRERGLTAADFVVKEDGVPVEVALRGTPDDSISVGMVVDASTSMRPLIIDVVEDANEFISRALQPGDQAFVVAFEATPHLVQPLTADLQSARAAVMDVVAAGGTALWDSIVFSLGQLRGVPGKRALLVFTDGEDNGSRTTAGGVIAFAREVGVPIYVFEMELPSRKESGAQDTRLQEIADSSGGALFAMPKKSELPRLFEQVRDDTRGEYILTYVSPSKKARTELRRVSVSLRRGGAVRATSGYYPR